MPTELLMRNVALLAKVEATYGVDPVPAAANAILVSDVKLTPMNMRTVSRDLIRSFLGSSEQLPTEIYTGIEFTCELAGSGAAGTAPALGPLLRACGFAETINAGVSVVYAPVSTGFESLTFHANLDGVLHKGLGARGTVRLSLKNHDRPTARFMFQGIFVAVADAALPAVDLSAWQRPQPVNKTNTPGITLHGYSAPLSDLQIDVANQVQFKSFVGGTDFVQITDRSVTGNVLMQAVKVADKELVDGDLGGDGGAAGDDPRHGGRQHRRDRRAERADPHAGLPGRGRHPHALGTARAAAGGHRKRRTGVDLPLTRRVEQQPGGRGPALLHGGTRCFDWIRSRASG